LTPGWILGAGVNFFEWLTTKRKTLATMNVAELRAQEMLMTSERDRMLGRVRKLANEKQEIVRQGAKEKTPEMRKVLAQQFDLLHGEQMMITRQLNMRSKELLTVARLRMLRENAPQRDVSSPLARITSRDLAVMERLIENEQVTSEAYQERLDDILQIGHAADEAAASGVSPAAEELLKVWNDMDAGLIADDNSAFDETERRVRERDRAADA
jgi:hypothetical protein